MEIEQLLGFTRDLVDYLNSGGANRHEADCISTRVVEYMQIGVSSQVQRPQRFKFLIQVGHDYRSWSEPQRIGCQNAVHPG